MSKITKSLSAKASKETGKSEILFRFIATRTLVLRAKSKIFINPKQWNEKKGELKTATFGQEEVEIKQTLDKLCANIIEKFTHTPIDDVDKDWLKNLINDFHQPSSPKAAATPRSNSNAKQQGSATFDIIKKFISSHTNNKRHTQHYEVVLRTLKRYELYKQKANRKDFFDIHSINEDDLNSIKDYLINEHQYFIEYPDIFKKVPESRTPKERGHNTIQGFYRRLRTIILWCNKQELTTNNPFKKFKISESIYGTPYYITIEERNIIYNTTFKTTQQEQQRDIFVFQCLIGCRVGDLLKLTKENLINGVIEYIPRKTKDGRPVTVKVPLNSIALEIINKYKDQDGAKLLPFISSQKYNEHIKSIFTTADIIRKVTVINPTTQEEEKRPLNEIASSHLARRTFIGNLYKKVKDPNLVGALSGHKEGSQAFARYREIDDEMRIELVKLLE